MLYVVESVIELSDCGLEDMEDRVVVVGSMVSARFRATKRPLLSRVMYVLRFILRVLGEAITRRF